jgi:hypothetical protein
VQLLPSRAELEETVGIGRGKGLKPAAGLPAWVQIPDLPGATFRLLNELLDRVRLGYLVDSTFRIACKFLHWEQGPSWKRVWRNHRIT